jgi:O-antigen/teichoic acid export membrane protein
MIKKTITTTQSTSASHPSKSDANILSAAKGSSITFFGMVFESIARFALGILMARLMGAEQYGLYNLAATAFYMIVGLAALGLFPAIVRYIAAFASHRDEASLWGTLQVGLGIPFVVSVLAGACLLVFAEPFARLMFHEPRLVPVLRVAAFALPLETLLSMAGAATRGFNRLQYNVIASHIFLPLIKLIIVIALAITGLNAVKTMTAHAIGEVAACVMLLYFLHKLFPLNRPWRAGRRNVKEMLLFSLPIYGSRLITLFGQNMQTVLLGAFSEVMSVGVFSAAARVNLVGTMFDDAINTAAEPIVSELYTKEEHGQLRHFYQNMTKWTFAVGLPIFFITLLFSKPILSVFGDDFTAGSVALAILSCGGLVKSSIGITEVMIMMTGNTWLKTVNTILALVLGTVLSFWLIPRFDVVGAAIAISGVRSVLGLACIFEVFALFRLLPYNKSFVKPLVAGVVAAVAAYATAQWVFVESNLLGTVLNIGFLMAVYVAVMLLLGLSEEDRIVLAHLRGRLKTALPG